MPGFHDSIVLRPPEVGRSLVECHICNYILKDPYYCLCCNMKICQSCLLDNLKCPLCFSSTTAAPYHPQLGFNCTKCNTTSPLSEIGKHELKCAYKKCGNSAKCSSPAVQIFSDAYCSKACQTFVVCRENLGDTEKILKILFK